MEPGGKKASWISRSGWMLYLTRDQSSSYHLSLPRGTRFCRLVPSLWVWFSSYIPFRRGNEVGGGGQEEYEETMITVTVWKVHSASHDSLIVLLKITHSAGWQVPSHHGHALETSSVTPACRWGRVSALCCYSCGGGFIPRCHLFRLRSPAQLLTPHIHFHHQEKSESRGGRRKEK